MRYVTLGTSGLLVSEIVLGTARFGEGDVDVDRIVGTALDLGINTFDTADIYADSRSEQLLGQAVAHRRDQLVIASKAGMRVGDKEADHGAAMRNCLDHSERWHRGIAPTDQGLSRKHLVSALDASLKRLGTDYVDLYQVHRWDPLTPIDETLATLDDLVHAGKVRYVGCSGFAAWQVVRGLLGSARSGLARWSSVQLPYNLLARDAERELLPACAHEGLGVLVFQLLAGGLLSDRYLDQASEPTPDSRLGSRRSYRQLFWNDTAFTAVRALRAVSEATGRSMSQLALGWVLANPAVSAGLFGVSKPEQLLDVVDVIDHPLTEEELRAVDDAVSTGADGA
jgi:1-deoxyxylulose-5-phosphate synthase